MRLLFLGDVMGRSGRAAVAERLPALRKDWKLDFVVVNAENASGGMGLTPEHARALLQAGADVLTFGGSCLRPVGHAPVHRAGAADHPPAELRQGRAGQGRPGL
jgi:calcineurin-like phosphoesterase